MQYVIDRNMQRISVVWQWGKLLSADTLSCFIHNFVPLVATKLQLQTAPYQNTNICKNVCLWGVEILSQYAQRQHLAQRYMWVVVQLTNLLLYIQWNLPLCVLNIWLGGPQRWSGYWQGKKLPCLYCNSLSMHTALQLLPVSVKWEVIPVMSCCVVYMLLSLSPPLCRVHTAIYLSIM
jgi:hypothetical protein